MQPLAQPPRKDDRSFDDWMYRLWKRISSTAGIAWSLIDKTGSNLTDLTTRNHADLQNINTASYTHLTSTNATDLTDGGDSTLHYHASDRDSANFTGTSWTDLTDSGATTLHKHDHNLQDNVQGGTTNEFYHNTLHEDGLVDIIDTQWSTGIVGLANLVTDSGSGEIDIASCDVLLRATNSDTVDIAKYTVPALTNQALTDLANNKIYAEYNAGTPRFIITTTPRTDTNTNILIANVYRNGTSLHINNYVAVRANDNMRRVALRFVETLPLGYVSGGILSETGTRNIAVTAGSFWICTNPFTTNAFNSATGGTFSYEYRDGAGGWTEQTAQTQINNTQYDDGSGTLQTLTANRYAVAWVYQEVDNDIVVLYGQGDYTLAQANAVTAPASVPPRISAQGYLIGKIVLQKGSATFSSVESAFTTTLSTSVQNDHNQLAGLQGGTANEYYHLTSAQKTVADTVLGASSTAAFDALAPTTTQGDLIYNNGTDNVRLAKGTAGQVLTMNGGATAPIWATPSGSNSIIGSAISGWTYSNNVSDATNDIDIAAGSGLDSTRAYFISGTALTKQSDAAWAVGTNAGMLDTGAVGNNDYYIWAIARSDTGVVDYLSSLSSTAPTMPANYDYKRLIGWFKRVGGTIVAFHTYEIEGGGIEFRWDSPTLDVSLGSTLTTSRRTDAIKVPLTFSVVALINLYVYDAAAQTAIWITCPDHTDLAPTLSSAAPLANGSSVPNTSVVSTQYHIRTSSTGTIAARANIATVDVYNVATIGFTWGRRV